MERESNGNHNGRLEEATRRFESWRASRKRRGRVPAALWTAAEALAREHGVHRTARTLHLNYAALAKRVRAQKGPAAPQPTFVEYPGNTVLGSSGCVLELQSPKGAKLRLELPHIAAGELAMLVRGLWGSAR